MYFLSDLVQFGAVKQANKSLKRLNEIKMYPSYYRKPTGDLAKKVTESDLKGLKLIESKKDLDKYIQRSRQLKKGVYKKQDPLTEILGDITPWAETKTLSRGENRKQTRLADNKPVLTRKYKSGEQEKAFEKKLVPDDKSFTDIRKTSDTAASPTGYLGFRTDPYKGYGGMMEEPVTLKRIKTEKPRIKYSSPINTSDFGFVLPKKYNAAKIQRAVELDRVGLKYLRDTEKKMFAQHPEIRDPRKLIRLAGVRSNLATQIKNKQRILKGDS